MCPPEKYTESSYSFRRKCLSTKWMEVHEDGTKERVFSQYKPDKLTRAIHLIRDPFDNIVSRYHLERQLPGRAAADYPKTREGFRSYCNAIDNLHQANEKRALFLDEDLLKIMSVVPCHADFFRCKSRLLANISLVAELDFVSSNTSLHPLQTLNGTTWPL